MKRLCGLQFLNTKKSLKIRPERKCLDLYKVLLRKFEEAGSKGSRIDFSWIWSKARNLNRELTNDPGAIIRKHVIANFLKRHNIRMRRKEQNREPLKEAFRQKLVELVKR